MVDGEVMFHGGDGCKILGYANTSVAMECHCKYWKILRSSETLDLNLNSLAVSCSCPNPTSSGS